MLRHAYEEKRKHWSLCFHAVFTCTISISLLFSIIAQLRSKLSKLSYVAFDYIAINKSLQTFIYNKAEYEMAVIITITAAINSGNHGEKPIDM